MIVNIVKKIQDRKTVLNEECKPYDDSFIIWMDYYSYSHAYEKIYKSHLIFKYIRNLEQTLNSKFNADRIFNAVNLKLTGRFYSKDDKTYTNETVIDASDDDLPVKFPQENPKYRFIYIKRIGIEFVTDGQVMDIGIEQLTRLCKIVVYTMDIIHATDAIMPSECELSHYFFNNFKEDINDNYDLTFSHLVAIYNEITGQENKDALKKDWESTAKTGRLEQNLLYFFKTLGKWKFSEHDIKIGCDVATKSAEAEIIKGKTATQQEIDRIYKIFLRYIFTEPDFSFTVKVAGRLIGQKNPKYSYDILPEGEIVDA